MVVAHRVGCSWLLTAALFAGVLVLAPACTVPASPETARAAPPELAPAHFVFAPPDGMSGVRTDRRTSEISLSGTKLRSQDEQVFRWAVTARREGDATVMSESLTHTTLRRGGETLVDGDIPPGAVTGQVVLNPSGGLAGVSGLDGAAEALRSSVSPESAPYVGEVLSPDRLRAMTATYYGETASGFAGRPTRVGSTWTTFWTPGIAVRGATVSVDGSEPCGSIVCARLRVSYQLDPRLVLQAVSPLLADYARERGASSGAPTLRSGGHYTVVGMLLSEPSTLTNRQTLLAETGRIKAVVGSRTVSVELRAEVHEIFEHAGPPAVAAAPEQAPRVRRGMAF